MNSQAFSIQGPGESVPGDSASLAGDKILTRGELLSLAENWRGGFWELLSQAHRIRTVNFGRAVRLCSIVPGKLGGCRSDCRWCAQSVHVAPTEQGGSKRTALSEIVSEANAASGWGSANIGIVNSGIRPTQQEIDDVLQAAAGIEQATNGKISVCASLGMISEDQAKQLAESRIVTRYHHNLETSRRFYPEMVSAQTYDGRVRTLQSAKAAGLSICCGGLFGLGETWEDRVDLALTIRDEIQPDVVPLNFLIPMAETPLADQQKLSPLEILAVIAIFRLAMPRVDIKIAGGRESNMRSLQRWVFYAGATSIMVGNYLTTAGKSPREDLVMIEDLGLRVVSRFDIES